MQRDIPWPGKQINEINAFRQECYSKCHADNPTDSGWYEKTDECGQRCKKALQEFEYKQGKNPCELKLQAPVFWFENSPSGISEHYTHTPNERKRLHSPQSTDRVQMYVSIVAILLVVLYLFLYAMFP
jgi:hypothetical protein